MAESKWGRSGFIWNRQSRRLEWSPGPASALPRRYNAASDLLDGNLEAGRGERVAIRTTDGAVLTYSEVAAAANRAGTALRELGVEMENRVLMAVLDGPEVAA